ncbi:MAG: extracellular solute-binding protein [Dactylosporangium sp.]|nr:extracellular solute-binding protein [Dactylosporangium sp.]
MNALPWQWRAVGVALAVTVATSVAACGSSEDDDAKNADSGGTYEIWDPYPQYDDSAAWMKVINDCAAQAGVSVKRTAMDTTELGKKILLATQQGNPPDIAIVDNPVVSTLGEADALATTEVSKMDASAMAPNLLGAGQSKGKTYGIPIGANSLALFYNKDILTKAGVDPATVKDWASLTAALAKVKTTGKKGITFSAIGTEEGTFQFLPWFWGSGAQLTKLDSPEAVSALALWKGWLDQGYVGSEVIGYNQAATWEEFAKGDVAFGENGTWQIGNAKEAGFEVGVISIPKSSGGVAPSPTGGEFLTMPKQQKTDRYTTSSKIVACLTGPENLLALDTGLNYIAPTTAMQDSQATTTPELKVWVEAVRAAKPRTGDNLGTKYNKISQSLWTAVQAVFSGAQTPQDALAAAQTQASGA